MIQTPRSRPLTPLLQLLSVSAVAAFIGGCGNVPTPKGSQPVQAAPQGASAPTVQPALETTPPTPSALDTPRIPRTPPLDGESYADREDAHALALAIALEHNLDAHWVGSTLANAIYKAQASRLMMPAPSGTAKNWAVYRSRFIEPIRVRAGVNFWNQYASDLARAERQYGVPQEILAGVIGVETIYGRHKGNFRVLDVLTTLALDFPTGRSDRSPFFKRELAAFLKLCDEQRLDPQSVLGSYAGAIGWPQFMPSSIRRWGIDFDGDGQIDLQNNPVDAIGSVANYLASHGWQSGQPARYEVTPPTDPLAREILLGPDIKPTFTATQMQNLGAILPSDGQQHPGLMALVLLENGNNAPTLIAGTQNFYAITRYNQSSYYALAVIELGESVKAASEKP